MKKNNIEKISLGDGAEIRPMIKKSNMSAKELSQMLLKTTYEGYSNTAEPLLTIGLAVMARFKDDFVKHTKGFPVAYLHGTTSAGKTNLLNNIAFLLGLEDDYIYSGDSTVLSMWQRLDSCSCMPVIYDEISRRVLNDTYLEGFIKAAFQGINRDKIAKIKTTINATLILSSNFQPPQRPEILNRLLLCNFEQKSFKLAKVIDFNPIRKNHLSALLQSIVKQKPDDVIEIFKEKITFIKKINPDLGDRCVNNIAIAYTGYQILLNIAEEAPPKEVVKNFEQFIKNYGEALKVASPWDEFITALPILARNKAIVHERDYKYAYGSEEKAIGNRTEIIKSPSLLCIHFEKVYQVFSAYYRQLKRDYPPTQKELLLYAKNDKRIIPGKDQVTKGIRINGIKKKCLVLDIRNDEDLCVLDKM